MTHMPIEALGPGELSLLARTGTPVTVVNSINHRRDALSLFRALRIDPATALAIECTPDGVDPASGISTLASRKLEFPLMLLLPYEAEQETVSDCAC